MIMSTYDELVEYIDKDDLDTETKQLLKNIFSPYFRAGAKTCMINTWRKWYLMRLYNVELEQLEVD